MSEFNDCPLCGKELIYHKDNNALYCRETLAGSYHYYVTLSYVEMSTIDNGNDILRIARSAEGTTISRLLHQPAHSSIRYRWAVIFKTEKILSFNKLFPSTNLNKLLNIL